MAEIKPDVETFARIKVVGVGGSGNSAVSCPLPSVFPMLHTAFAHLYFISTPLSGSSDPSGNTLKV